MVCCLHLKRKRNGKRGKHQVSILTDGSGHLYLCFYFDPLTKWSKLHRPRLHYLDRFLTLYQFSCCNICFLVGDFMTPEKTQDDYKTFVFKSGGVRRILPYLAWSCICLLKTAIFGGIAYALIFGKVAIPFYYIVVMIQLTIITQWLIRSRMKWMYLVTPAYMVIIYI